MEGERPLVVTEEYERLGGKKLSLIDVLAQSVGFIGPVFSAAFIIPLIIGVNAAARGAGTSAALAVADRRRSACSRSAGSWPSTRSGSMPPARSTTTCRTASARPSARAAGWLYYGGTIILTTGLGVLIGGYVHDNLLPVVGDRPRSADLGLGHDLRAPAVRGAVLRRQDLDARAAHARADLDRGGADLLHHRDRGPWERERRREGVRPDAATRWVQPGSCSGSCTGC